jgi:hypothetical protein
MPQSIEMTRQQLYDLVWSRSMGEAAASIPMSHVSLKKLCAKHEVPGLPQAHSLAHSRADLAPRYGDTGVADAY